MAAMGLEGHAAVRMHSADTAGSSKGFGSAWSVAQGELAQQGIWSVLSPVVLVQLGLSLQGGPA